MRQYLDCNQHNLTLSKQNMSMDRLLFQQILHRMNHTMLLYILMNKLSSLLDHYRLRSYQSHQNKDRKRLDHLLMRNSLDLCYRYHKVILYNQRRIMCKSQNLSKHYNEQSHYKGCRYCLHNNESKCMLCMYPSYRQNMVKCIKNKWLHHCR